MEEIIIELGHDPKDPKGIQALIKRNNKIFQPSEAAQAANYNAPSNHRSCTVERRGGHGEFADEDE